MTPCLGQEVSGIRLDTVLKKFDVTLGVCLCFCVEHVYPKAGSPALPCMSYPTNHPGDKVESHIKGSGVPTTLLSKRYSTRVWAYYVRPSLGDTTSASQSHVSKEYCGFVQHQSLESLNFNFKAKK